MKRVAVVAVVALGVAPGAFAAERSVSVSTSISPRPVFFGQRVTARAEVVAQRPVRADSIELTPSFAPYTLVGHPRVSRVASGDVTTVGVVYRLVCLNEGCLPTNRTRAVRLRPLRVRARGWSGEAYAVVARWPDVTVSPRVTAAAAKAPQPRWRVQLGLPAVTWRTKPGAWMPLATTGALLFLAGAALIAFEVRRRRRLLRERAERRSALVRALALVREAERRDVEDRRKALSLLSRLLAAENGAQLARDAERLAWARSEPAPERIDALVREVESRMARR